MTSVSVKQDGDGNVRQVIVVAWCQSYGGERERHRFQGGHVTCYGRERSRMYDNGMEKAQGGQEERPHGCCHTLLR